MMPLLVLTYMWQLLNANLTVKAGSKEVSEPAQTYVKEGKAIDLMTGGGL